MTSMALIGSLLFFLLFKTPISLAMGLAVIIGCWVGDYPIHVLAQGILEGSMNWNLLSVIFFIIAGNIMNACGVAERIFEFAKACVGHWAGGLAHVNIVCSMIFAGISGSAAADCAALGPLEIKAMSDAKYELKHSVGITLASSMLGPIIPPSVSFILYGVLAEVSIAKLFLAGIGPELLIGFVLMLVCGRIAKRSPEVFPRGPFTPMKQRLHIFKTSVWALLAPIIILTGMSSGAVSPTEAGVVAVVYSLVLGLCYRSCNVRELWAVMKNSMYTSAHSLIFFGVASTLSFILTLERTPILVAEYVMSLTQNKYLVLLFVDVVLLVIGCFTTAGSAMILLTPIFLPLLLRLGVDPVQLGVIMAFGLTIGISTPPVGIGLFVLSEVAGISVEDVVKGMMPFYFWLFLLLAVITFVPQISLFIPNLLAP